MKIIFLDIDGVLNSEMYEWSRGEDRADNRIDLSRVRLLKDIVSATDAKIVLSSTWRLDWDKSHIYISGFLPFMSTIESSFVPS